MTNSIFINTIKGEKCSRPPVWFMRQAGRILPSYLELRKQYSFQELMTNPQLTAKVTLLPVNDLKVDAAISFSDILVIPEALGMDLTFTDKGPVFSNPIKNIEDAAKILKPNASRLNNVYEAIKLIKQEISSETALIGFCGAPFTTFCYMVEGNSSKHTFSDAIQMIYSDKNLAKKIFEQITELSVEYAVNQVKSGIDTFQSFETHAGLLPADLYIELVLPYVKTITKAVREAGCPTIFFPKGLSNGIKELDFEVADYISIDWQSSLKDSRSIVDKRIGLQGNIDPRIFSVKNKEVLLNELEKYKSFGKDNFNWIFNAGHGVSPDNLYQNVQFTIEWIKDTQWNR